MRKNVPVPFMFFFNLKKKIVLTENHFPILQIHQTLRENTHKQNQKNLTEWLTCNPEEDVSVNITFAH